MTQSMKKKAELTINYLIVIILALIVLIVASLIFRDQIIDFVNNIRGISSILDLGTAAEGLSP